MPKSKPPRRRRRRHLTHQERGLVDFFDQLQRITDRSARGAAALADRVPPEELAAMRATCAENRRIFAEARAEMMAPSRTPVLDRLVTEMRQKERAATRPARDR